MISHENIGPGCKSQRNKKQEYDSLPIFTASLCNIK